MHYRVTLEAYFQAKDRKDAWKRAEIVFENEDGITGLPPLRVCSVSEVPKRISEIPIPEISENLVELL